MAVISKLYYDGKDITKYNNELITNINLNGVDCNFARKKELSGLSKVTCADAVPEPIIDMQIMGNSIQDGVPTPETPAEIKSVGERTNNLFDISKRTLGELSGSGANTEIRNFEFDKYYIGLTANNYYYSWMVTEYDIGEKEISMTCSGAGYGIALPFKVQPNENYYLSVNGDKALLGVGFYTIGGENIGSNTMAQGTVTIPENCEIMVVVLRTEVLDVKVTFTEVQVASGAEAEYEPYGYKVPVKANEATTNIYIKEPLRKVGDYADYIDYKNKKVVRNVAVLDDSGTQTIENSYQGLDTPIEETIDMPEISTARGTTIFEFDTEVSPSFAKVNYWKQIGTDVVATEEIIQDGSSILIIRTGAELTQSGTTLTIGD